MKKPYFFLTAALLFLFSCENRDLADSCDAVSPELVIEWIDKASSQKPDYYWINKAEYEGRTIFIAPRWAQYGIGICGTGLVFEDMNFAFDCQGRPVKGIQFEDIQHWEEFFNTYQEQIPQVN